MTTTSLSHVIIANAGSGLVVAHHGAANGPLMFSGVVTTLGPTLLIPFEQGQFTGYVRRWTRASNGDTVIVAALKLKDPTKVSTTMDTITRGLHLRGQSFAVSGVPGAIGVQDRLGAARAYRVAFLQDGLIFLVSVATHARGLPVGAASALARRQVARVTAATGAPPPADPSSNLVVLIGGIALVVLLAGGFFAVGRRALGSHATTRATWGTATYAAAAPSAAIAAPPRRVVAVPPTAPPAAQAAPAVATGAVAGSPAAVDTASGAPPVAEDGAMGAAASVVVAPPQAPSESSIYCSWCGKERPMGAHAIHHCGSLERPPAFCIGCGTALVEGAASCATCGTSSDETSKRR